MIKPLSIFSSHQHNTILKQNPSKNDTQNTAARNDLSHKILHVVFYTQETVLNKGVWRDAIIRTGETVRVYDHRNVTHLNRSTLSRTAQNMCAQNGAKFQQVWKISSLFCKEDQGLIIFVFIPNSGIV